MDMEAADNRRVEQTTTPAMEEHSQLLNIFEYVEAVKYDIKMFLFSRFWHCINENGSIQLDRAVLEWLGYDSAKRYDNKASFIKLLRRHNIEYREIKHTDPEFDKVSSSRGRSFNNDSRCAEKPTMDHHGIGRIQDDGHVPQNRER